MLLALLLAAAPELFLPGLVSTGADDAHASFAPDGTVYFLRDTPDFAHWTALETRLEHGRPRHLPELGSAGDEWFPTMTDDGVLYFGSERPGGKGKADLWRSRWVNGRFSEPENLGPAINTAGQEIEPLIAPNGDFLIFAGEGRSGSRGAYDLYVTRECPDGWTQPQALGAGVNSAGWDFGPRLSRDGRWFYFTSNRSALDQPPARPRRYSGLMRVLNAPGNGLRDVYRVPAASLRLPPACPR